MSNDCCSKAIGFVQVALQPGTNLITDPLAQIDSSIGQTNAPNTLQTLMNPTNGTFKGVAVEVWNGQGMDTYTNDGSYWYLNGNTNGDGPLRPGASALVISTNTSPIPLAFVGLVRDGVYVAGTNYAVGTNYVTNYITSPTNYLASILPRAGGLSTVLSFPATHGDRVQLWSNGTTLKTYTYTNTGGGTNWTWSPSEPVLGMGQGFILTTTNVNNAWVQWEAPSYGQ